MPENKEIAWRSTYDMPVTRDELLAAVTDSRFRFDGPVMDDVDGLDDEALRAVVNAKYAEALTKQYQIFVNWQRPVNLPEGWEIWNASRPLRGHKEWQGDFVRGIFYAAIDPDHADASRYRGDNLSLDAAYTECQPWEVHQKVVEGYRLKLAAQYPDLDLGDADFEAVEESYLNRIKIRIMVYRE